MSRIDECGNDDCRRPFHVSEVGIKTAGGKEPEEITCPHCGWTTTERSLGVFRTSPLSAEDEAEYLLKKGG